MKFINSVKCVANSLKNLAFSDFQYFLSDGRLLNKSFIQGAIVYTLFFENKTTFALIFFKG